MHRHHHAGRRFVVRVRVRVAVDGFRTVDGLARNRLVNRRIVEVRRVARRRWRTSTRTRRARGACSCARSSRTRPHPRTSSIRRSRPAPRSRQGARTARRDRCESGRRPTSPRRADDSCRGSRAQRRRARRRPRRAPSTDPNRSGRRAGGDRAAGRGRRLSPRHVSGPSERDRKSYASPSISSKPKRRASTSTPGSGTAVVSITMPTQHVSQCEISVTLNAAPDGGPNAYSRSTAGAGREHRYGRPGNVRRDEVAALEHAAEQRRRGRGGQPVQRTRERARHLQRRLGAPLAYQRADCLDTRGGSSIAAGTGKRAGANRLPPASSSALRKLMGNVIRNASGAAP